MDASGSGCWCHVSRSSFCSSSPPHVSHSLRLRCSPLCSYTLLFTTSRWQKAACLLERFPPPPVCLYFFSSSHSPPPASTSSFLSHTLLLWPHYFIFFSISSCLFAFSLLSLSLVLFFCFLICWFPCSSASSFSLSLTILSLSLYTSFFKFVWTCEWACECVYV